jgi:hypothetical protein
MTISHRIGNPEFRLLGRILGGEIHVKGNDAGTACSESRSSDGRAERYNKQQKLLFHVFSFEACGSGIGFILTLVNRCFDLYSYSYCVICQIDILDIAYE